MIATVILAENPLAQKYQFQDGTYDFEDLYELYTYTEKRHKLIQQEISRRGKK